MPDEQQDASGECADAQALDVASQLTGPWTQPTTRCRSRRSRLCEGGLELSLPLGSLLELPSEQLNLALSIGERVAHRRQTQPELIGIDRLTGRRPHHIVHSGRA